MLLEENAYCITTIKNIKILTSGASSQPSLELSQTPE